MWSQNISLSCCIFSSLILIEHFAFLKMARLLQKYIYSWHWMVPFHYQFKYHLKIEMNLQWEHIAKWDACQCMACQIGAVENGSRGSQIPPERQKQKVALTEWLFFFLSDTNPWGFHSVIKQNILCCSCSRQRCYKLIILCANIQKRILQEDSLIDCVER